MLTEIIIRVLAAAFIGTVALVCAKVLGQPDILCGLWMGVSAGGASEIAGHICDHFKHQ